MNEGEPATSNAGVRSRPVKWSTWIAVLLPSILALVSCSKGNISQESQPTPASTAPSTLPTPSPPPTSVVPSCAPKCDLASSPGPAPTCQPVDSPLCETPKSPGTKNPKPNPTGEIEAAVLGSQLDGFVLAFGQWTKHSMPDFGQYNFDLCGGNGDELIVEVDPETNRIYALTRGPCGNDPPRETDGQVFFPSDASYIRSYTNQYGEEAKEYRSTMFGSEIATDWFTDCDGNQAKSGIFSLVVDPSQVSLAAGDCNN